jgi:acyl-coenzyme A thioesterase PaaI-like protein
MVESPSPRVPQPRRLSRGLALWLLRLYPPLLFAGVTAWELSSDFRRCTVRVRRSLLNRNLNGTIFGGAIAAAADPIHSILYWQALALEGRAVEAWLASVQIDYRKPGRSALELEFVLEEADLDAARRALDAEGRFRGRHRVEAIDRTGEVCAVIESGIYLRRRR